MRSKNCRGKQVVFFSASLTFAISLCMGGGVASLGVCHGQVADQRQVDQPQFERTWELGPTGSRASLRGLCAVDDNVIWACGSGATVLRSRDRGSSWEECGPAGLGALEFRSVHAFDHEHALIASAGSPAIIMRTTDGGVSWREVFRHEAAEAFLNSLRFSDAQYGVAVGDPIDGRLLVLETTDGGALWRPIPGRSLPESRVGEAGFAASNSCVLLSEFGGAWIGTGGTDAAGSRVYYRVGAQEAWSHTEVPIPSGPTQGVFSLAMGAGRLLAVGGDYVQGASSPLTVAVSDDLGRNWRPSSKPPSEFRSSVVHLSASSDAGLGSGFWVATGPSGSDWSVDGDVWHSFSAIGFHALDVGHRDVFAVGSEGRFAILSSAH